MGDSSTRVPALRSLMYSPTSATSPAMSLPEDVRQLDSGEAFANKQIEMVQCAGAHANQYVIFAQLRIGNVFVLSTSGPPNS